MSFSIPKGGIQRLTAGLVTGESIHIHINYRVVADGWLRYGGWATIIEGELNGQRAFYSRNEIGSHGGQDNVVLQFTGKMPPQSALQGQLIFRGFYHLDPFRPPFGSEFHRHPLTIPNLEYGPPAPPAPPEPPPVICQEGATYCDGYTLMVCKNGKWVVHEYWSEKCGYSPPPGPPPPYEPPPYEPPPYEPPKPPPTDIPWETIAILGAAGAAIYLITREPRKAKKK